MHGKEGPQAVSQGYAEAARVEWVQNTLVDYGRTRAESLGWTDVYTLTKSFAERAAEELWAAERAPPVDRATGHHRERPASSVPGLDRRLQGRRPADHRLRPRPAARVPRAARQRARRHPGRLRRQRHPRGRRQPVAPSGSPSTSTSDPARATRCRSTEMFENIHTLFSEHPCRSQGSDEHIIVPTWKFPGGRQVEKRTSRARSGATTAASDWLERFGSSARSRAKLANVQQRKNDLEVLQQLHRALPRLRADRDHLRRRQHQGPARVASRRSAAMTSGSMSRRSTGRTTCRTCTSRRSRRMTRVFATRPAGDGAGRQGACRSARTSSPSSTSRAPSSTRTSPTQYLWVRSAGLRKAAWPGEFLEPARQRARLPAGRAARPRRVHPRLPAPLRGHAVRAAREGRHGRLRAIRCCATRCRRPLQRIQEHRDAGHRTILVTGSIGILASPLAGLFDEVVGEHDAPEGRRAHRLPRAPAARRRGSRRLAAPVRRRRTASTSRQSYGYGDSHADLVWLELLGNPSAVNPDTNLSREAQRRRWRIYNWKRGSQRTDA